MAGFIRLAILAAALTLSAAASAEEVDLELVLLADATGSIDNNEIRFQRQGYAEALTDPDVLDAIEKGIHQKIAVTYVEWGDFTSQDVVVPWRIIGSAAEAQAFADELLLPPRRARGRNAIGQALLFGKTAIETNEHEGIRKVIDSQMADLIHKSTLERGFDPREFVIVAYGGAGPVHAASYAAEVGVRKILVPFFATVHSAFGAALSDVRFSLQYSHPLVPPVDPGIVENIYAKMESDGSQRLDAADVPKAQQRHERWVEARYRRQVHNLRVPAPARIDEAGLALMLADFEKEYARLFGSGAALKDAGIEFVNYGVNSIGAVTPPVTTRWPDGGDISPRTHRMISSPFISGSNMSCKVTSFCCERE